MNRTSIIAKQTDIAAALAPRLSRRTKAESMFSPYFYATKRILIPNLKKFAIYPFDGGGEMGR